MITTFTPEKIKLLITQSQSAEPYSDEEMCVLDGPFKDGKAFMLFKFRTMIKMLRGKTVEDAMNIMLIKKFSGGDPEALKPMIEPIIKVAPYLNDNSIRNEVECCYTFDFPQFDTEMQKRMHFFYDKDEKACRTCLKLVQKAYPQADYRIVNGYEHLTYCCTHTEEYIDWIKEICG